MEFLFFFTFISLEIVAYTAKMKRYFAFCPFLILTSKTEMK